MARRTVVNDEDLQQVWETEFTHHIFSGNGINGQRKFITAVICRDTITYQVFYAGCFMAEYNTMADAVGEYNQL